MKLSQSRRPWRQVRFWLYDFLALEIAAATKDGTLPATLALDRVWITGEGRAKLLDFPAPGLAGAGMENGGAGQSGGGFLLKVATAALMGTSPATLALRCRSLRVIFSIPCPDFQTRTKWPAC